ncbi:hypothetical protein LCGC14_1452730 [marine sediment metagenome]|uniref:HNH endonuclease n=2 Tax=root TaxID=1 RepID=A0A831VLG5_9FLAO|nr:HNH endonuclease [Methylophaga sp.]HEA19665.1 HNH endonuclease [Pricia antarctica]
MNVFKRDGFACQICYKIGVYLEAHHIIRVSENIDLIMVLKNGITVCYECHNQIHSKEFKQYNWEALRASNSP